MGPHTLVQALLKITEPSSSLQSELSHHSFLPKCSYVKGPIRFPFPIDTAKLRYFGNRHSDLMGLIHRYS